MDDTETKTEVAETKAEPVAAKPARKAKAKPKKVAAKKTKAKAKPKPKAKRAPKADADPLAIAEKKTSRGRLLKTLLDNKRHQIPAGKLANSIFGGDRSKFFGAMSVLTSILAANKAPVEIRREKNEKEGITFGLYPTSK